jgi:SAM-dependent methyltransferase
MRTTAMKNYFNATEHSEIRSDLSFALKLVGKPKIAVDCGCGSGSDIEHLASLGFTVHGFDLETEAVARCQKRFRNNDNVILSQDNFISFKYPKASLVVADASLFFCPAAEFPTVWQKINACLFTGGVFVGSFLGPNDTMANSKGSESSFWENDLTFNESELQNLFKSYKIHNLTEHSLSGTTNSGHPHQWHIFSVVAQKV